MWNIQRKSGHYFVCLNKTNIYRTEFTMCSPFIGRSQTARFNEYKRIAYKSTVIPSTMCWSRVAFMRYTVGVVYKTRFGNNTKSEPYNQINLINGADKESNAFKFDRIVPSDFRSYKRSPLCITYDRCCSLVLYCEKFVFVKPISQLVTRIFVNDYCISSTPKVFNFYHF